MKTRVLFADGVPVASCNDEDAAADATMSAAESRAIAESQRAGRPLPEFKTETRDDCREKAKAK